MRKQFFSVVLSVCMVITMLPVTAKADEQGEPVQSINYASLNTGPAVEVSTFADLQAAVDEATTSLSLKLSDGYVTEKGTLRIPKGSQNNITLDLNGKTLNGGSKSAIDHQGSGTLTITDSRYSGKISSSGFNTNAIRNTSSGTINITGGTISSSGLYARNVFNESSGTVNISGGTFIADGSGVTNIYNYSKGAVNISGGTFAAKGDSVYVLYNTLSKDITISGGSLSAVGDKARAVYSFSTATVKISGGTLSAEGNQATAIYIDSTIASSYANSLIMTGGKVTARGNKSYGIYSQKNSIVEIYGGDVSAYGDPAYAIFGAMDCKTYIYGGEIYAYGSSAYGIYMDIGGTVRLNRAIVIAEGSPSGIGIYANDIYVDSGFNIIRGSGQAQNKAATIRSLSAYDYTVGSRNFNGSSSVSYNDKDLASYKYIQYALATPVATIGATTYTSLNSAIANARDGATIKLLSTPTILEPIKLSKGNIIIDMNGYSIISYIDTIFELYNNVTLTITNSSDHRGEVTSHDTVTIMMYDNANLVINNCDVFNYGSRGRTIYNVGSGSVKLRDSWVGSSEEMAVSSQKIVISGTCIIQGGVYAMSSLPEFRGYTDPVKVTAFRWDGEKRVEVPYSEDYLKQYVYLVFEPDAEN